MWSSLFSKIDFPVYGHWRRSSFIRISRTQNRCIPWMNVGVRSSIQPVIYKRSVLFSIKVHNYVFLNLWYFLTY